MNEEKELIDQSELAKSVSDQIKYQFLDYFLVKPLDPIKVKKEVSVPVTDEDPKKDKNGVEAKDFDDVKTEVVEVDSDYRKAVVIKLPVYYENNKDYDPTTAIKAGDIVIIREAAGLRFDLIKDSRLVRLFDILGIEK